MNFIIVSAVGTNFKQQRLKAWQPILTASTALPLFFIIGIVFIPIGAVLLVASDKVSTRCCVKIDIAGENFICDKQKDVSLHKWQSVACKCSLELKLEKICRRSMKLELIIVDLSFPVFKTNVRDVVSSVYICLLCLYNFIEPQL